MGSLQLDSLPAELTIETFLHLPPLDVLHCRQICGRLKEIIDASNSLKIVIDMYEHGYLLVQPIQRPLIDIWDNFVKNHQLLMQGDPTGERQWVDMGDPWVIDGILVETENQQDPYNFTLPKPSTLTLRDAMDRKSKWYMHLNFSFHPIAGCAISKRNRLLAIVEEELLDQDESIVRVHLYDLYHGTPHSAALSPTLEFRQLLGGPSAISTTTYFDYIGVLLADQRVVIWNWKAGILLHVLADVDSFAFVSKDYLLTIPVDGDWPCENAFTAVTITTGEKLLLEIPIPKTAGNWGSKWAGNGGLNHVSAYKDLDRTPVPGILGSKGDYELDRSLDIIVCKARSPIELTAVISCRILHRFLTAFQQRNSPSTSIPWKEWGPEATRWVPRQGGMMWTLERPTAGPVLSYMVHDPFLSFQPNGGSDGSLYAARRFVMDFNHRPILRTSHYPLQSNISTTTEKWIFSHKDYSEDLECSLPFRSMSTFDIVKHFLFKEPCVDIWL